MNDKSIERAVQALRDGQLVAFPTETVYGLGANARDPAAVARLYAVKGRPLDHPVIVHVASAADLDAWAREVPAAARTLAARFWPGPLTLVLKRASGVRDTVTGGQDTVAVRCPDHPLALALLVAAQAAGMDGIVAPSANRFGRISPTTAAHVVDEFGDDVAVVIDGGPCAVGIESTIVDVSGGTPRVLRPGMITEEEIHDCVGDGAGPPATPAPRVSGALPGHYAPRTPLELVEASRCAARFTELVQQGHRVGLLASAQTLAHCPNFARAVIAAGDPHDYARELYAALRELDASACTWLVAELPPDGALWRGVLDRLKRAAWGSVAVSGGHPA